MNGVLHTVGGVLLSVPPLRALARWALEPRADPRVAEALPNIETYTNGFGLDSQLVNYIYRSVI